jgi:hypothetical protein
MLLVRSGVRALLAITPGSVLHVGTDLHVNVDVHRRRRQNRIATAFLHCVSVVRTVGSTV